MFLNQLVEFEISVTAYIIGESLVAYQIGYVADRCPRRQFQTLISQIMPMNSKFFTINVFPVLHTIFFLLGGQKIDFFINGS